MFKRKALLVHVFLQIVAMYQNGHSLSEVARVCNFSNGFIWKTLREASIPLRARGAQKGEKNNHHTIRCIIARKTWKHI